jgi:hypothetical protein
MTSNINPNNINTAYPVAGQDNNTEGFRRNFTNIKLNFQEAANEITALQNTSAVKGINAVNNFERGLIYNAVVKDLSVSVGSPVLESDTFTINYGAGHYQRITTPSSIFIVLDSTSFPPNGLYGFLRLEITVTDAAHTVTLPSSVTINRLGIQGLNPSTNVITFAAAGIYTFDFSTVDLGATVTINETNQQLQPFNNSSENLAPSAAASLSRTTSYFTTAGAETATLAAGVEGQIKVFAMQDTAGDMVITVTNAGWKTSGSGTVTFDAIGDACTLQYINAKWFCIGNNGCVFA